MLQVKEFLKIQYTTKSNENAINNNKKVYLKSPYILAFSTQPKLNLNIFVITIVKVLILQ